MFPIPSLLLYHPLSLLPICLMPLTPPTTPPQLKKIRLHSPFLHTQLPQMLPRVQYACKSKTLPSKNVSEGSSESAKTALPTLPASISLTPMSPLPANSITQIKKMCRRPSYPQLYVLVPQFKLNRLEEQEHPYHSPMTKPSIKPSSLPSREYETLSTTAVHTNFRLKRSSELAGLSSTAELPAKTKKQHCSLPNSMPYTHWDLKRIPLLHHHPLTSPFVTERTRNAYYTGVTNVSK